MQNLIVFVGLVVASVIGLSVAGIYINDSIRNCTKLTVNQCGYSYMICHRELHFYELPT